MENGKSMEDIFREAKYGIEYLEWEIESKQKELKEKKEWLEQALGKIQGNGDER